MSDDRKTRAQLIEELAAGREQWAEAEYALRKEQVLRRICRQVMGMTETSDLEAVLAAIRDGLVELQVPFENCGVNQVDSTSDPPTVRRHVMMEGEHWHGMQSDPVGSAVITRIWRDGGIAYRRDLEADDAYGEGDWLGRARPIRAVLDVPFSHGTLAVSSTQPDAFAGKDIVVLQDMAQAVSEALSRRDDFLARQRDRLVPIRHAVWDMRGTKDIQNLLLVLHQELKRCLPAMATCSVQVVDEETLDGVSYRVSGHVANRRVHEVHAGRISGTPVEECWREQRPVYRPDLREDDPYDETSGYGRQVRSVLDVPFQQGTLAVNSAQPDAFSEEDIEALQDMAQALSRGFARMVDLQALEQRNQELEQRDRLLRAFHEIGLIAQQSLDERAMLFELSGQVVKAGVFRCLVASIVDREHNCIEEVCSQLPADRLYSRSLDGPDILARVARTGEMTTIEGWDEEVYTRSEEQGPESHGGKVAYFIPIKMGDRVLGVLATASTRAEKADTLETIEAMQPLVDQIAIALEHARFYEASQREIAERKQAEEALRAGEKRFRDLVENATDVIYTHDMEGNFTSANPAASRVFGYTSEEISNLSMRGLVDPEYLQLAQGKIREKLEGDGQTEPYELLTHGKDGSPIWVEVHTRLLEQDGQPVAIQGIARDITERKRIENVLAIQHRLAAALNATPHLDEGLRLCVEAAIRVSEMDCGGVYLVDDASGDLHLAVHQGLPPEFVRGASHYDVDSPNVRLIMAGSPIYTQHQGLDIPPDEARRQEGLRAIAIVPIRRQDRVVACLNVASHTLAEVPAAARDTLEGIAAQIAGAIYRLKTEEALRESDERYRQCTAAAGVGVWDWDPTVDEFYLDPSVKAILGYRDDEIPSDMSIWSSHIHPDYRDECARRVQACLEGTSETFSFEHRMIHKDGTDRWILARGRAVSDANGNVVRMVGTDTDVTARKQAEQSLLQSSRLIALGQMAAGMAHELNQPLTVISALAEGLQLRLERGIEMTPERLQTWSGEVIEGVERMSSIIVHLRTFSRDRSDEPEEQVTINGVVRAALAMTQAQLKSRGIEVALDLTGDLAPVLGDQHRLEQVLINLIHNARDAVEERLEQLSDTERSDWQMQLDIRTRQEQGQVVVEVADKGVGMEEEARLQVLEPFYTTKGPDRGTGLGLSISHAIVKDHGGEIECESQQGEGSVFRVRLPAIQVP